MRLIKPTLLTSLLLYILMSMYGIWTFTTESDFEHVDAALVLGTKVEGNEPSLALRERIDYAIWLYEQEFVDKIIFTGGKTNGSLFSEAEVSKSYAMTLGVPENHIIIEDHSLVTRENMINTKQIVEELELEELLLVSDPFHMKRALMMADVFGLDVQPAPTPSSIYSTWAEQFPFVLRETLAYIGNQLTFHHYF